MARLPEELARSDLLGVDELFAMLIRFVDTIGTRDYEEAL